MEEFLIGSCELQLSRLHFVASREPKKAAVAKLVELFKLSCDPQDHPIPIVVSPEELQVVLGESAISLDDLVRRPLPRPKLTPSGKLCGIHARQRYEAAIRVFGPDMWWTVRLYCIPAGSNIPELLSKETDQFYYQTAPSDGEVFLKVREYEESGRADHATSWRLRLSTCKQVALRALERQEEMLEKFDQLRVFPGLWDGLQLGNIQRCNALHATEEVLYYLEHVFDVWGRITLHDPIIQRATDIDTVKKLELLTPAVSSLDSDVVQELIESRQLFRSVCNPAVRNRIQDAILQITVLIPSIRTFHENMKLLSIGMTILRDHVIDRLGTQSVRAAMAACWEPPGTKCVMEYRENAFVEVDIRPTFEIAYRQVFMAALRNFPRLSANPPRRERRGRTVLSAAVYNDYLASFLYGVQKQGFRSRKVAACLKQLRICPTLRSRAVPETSFAELSLSRRCGRPFARSHSVVTAWFFLPEILTDRGASVPCALFVQEDFMCSFFGQHSVAPETLGATLRQRLREAEQYETNSGTSLVGAEESREINSPCPRSEGVNHAHRASFESGTTQASSSVVSIGLWRNSDHIPETASRRLISPPSERCMPPSQDSLVNFPANEAILASSSGRSLNNRVRHVDIGTLHLLDPPSDPSIYGHNSESVHSYRTHSSNRSLLRPESIGGDHMPAVYTKPASHHITGDLPFGWMPIRRDRSSEFSHGSRSIHSPRWFASMRKGSPWPSQPARERASSPETSLSSSGTIFSSRSLLLPDSSHGHQPLVPDYILSRGESVDHSPDIAIGARFFHAIRSGSVSLRSEGSTRSVFEPEELQGRL